MNSTELQACLRETLNELRTLVIEHHAYSVMHDEHTICPVCTKPEWDAILNKAAKLGEAGRQPVTPEVVAQKALVSATGWSALVARWRYKAGIIRAIQPLASLVDERIHKMTGCVADAWECAANELEESQQPNEKAHPQPVAAVVGRNQRN